MRHEADDTHTHTHTHIRSCGTSSSHMIRQNGADLCASCADDRDVGDREHKHTE